MSVLETATGTEVRVGRLEEIPLGEGRAFAAGDIPIAVFRPRSGALHATHAVCPHRGGPLADGQTDEQVVVCPLHLNAYRWADGASTTGAPPVQVFAVREQDGDLYVTLPA